MNHLSPASINSAYSNTTGYIAPMHATGGTSTNVASPSSIQASNLAGTTGGRRSKRRLSKNKSKRRLGQSKGGSTRRLSERRRIRKHNKTEKRRR